MIIDFSSSSRGLARLLDTELRNKTRINLDININYTPDVAADICYLPFPNESIDGMICVAILEHVYNPFLAADELHRILVPGGRLFVYVPWMFNYHAPAGEYSDYWRFSRDGIRYLFRKFSSVELCPVRGKVEIILNFIPRLGKRSRFHRMFRKLLQKFDRYDDLYTSGFNVFIIK